jgi:hypothetical protein
MRSAQLRGFQRNIWWGREGWKLGVESSWEQLGVGRGVCAFFPRHSDQGRKTTNVRTREFINKKKYYDGTKGRRERKDRQMKKEEGRLG